MKILLIEDNKDISNNICEVLELDWYFVTQVFNGDSWLLVGLEREFDLIILDLWLPGLDGISVCQKIREKNKLQLSLLQLADVMMIRFCDWKFEQMII